jgi:hypothetical protein
MKQDDPVAASVYTELAARIKQQDTKIAALEVSLGQIMQLVARVETAVKRSDKLTTAVREDAKNAAKLQARVRPVSR